MKIHYKGFMREKIQKNPITIGPEASFYEARNLIHEKGVRHVPVVDKNNTLVGIVTDRDIREAAPSDATLLSVQELRLDAFLFWRVENFMGSSQRQMP
jgi:acetoin utilization protein AcuB